MFKKSEIKKKIIKTYISCIMRYDNKYTTYIQFFLLHKHHKHVSSQFPLHQ